MFNPPFISDQDLLVLVTWTNVPSLSTSSPADPLRGAHWEGLALLEHLEYFKLYFSLWQASVLVLYRLVWSCPRSCQSYLDLFFNIFFVKGCNNYQALPSVSVIWFCIFDGNKLNWSCSEGVWWIGHNCTHVSLSPPDPSKPTGRAIRKQNKTKTTNKQNKVRRKTNRGLNNNRPNVLMFNVYFILLNLPLPKMGYIQHKRTSNRGKLI